MDLDRPEWLTMHGGYRVPYDPRDALLALESGKNAKAAWDELWSELFHQGDVGEASYAAVPHLVRIYASRERADWNTYAFVAIIEGARLNPGNPRLPAKMRDQYEAAVQSLSRQGVRELEAAVDPTLVASILAVIAIAKGQPTLGRLAVEFAEDERQEMIRFWEGQHR
ncbi:hypothetical protein H8B02_27560 [Bradyrhizobium sp. Pear77]|uniref:hypothetical protein n=1 Tax=Bradyrhizobium altum TaxID=1571202 RepID=UPI001E3DD85F|nr:hypothetical protein [Bradyrhizobium altum]MCC8957055.1 hypothetical protein [Bradyrhizobium altum]